MKKLFIPVIVLTVLALVLTACTPKPVEETPLPMNSLPDVLIAEGRLLPLNTLDQSFALPGQVAEVLVSDGETVTFGQPLARLAESPDLQAALARALQEELAARQALDVLQEAADLNLAQAKLDVLAAQEALEQAQEDLDLDETDENLLNLEKATAVFQRAEAALADLETGNGMDPDVQASAEARLASAEAAVASAQSALDALELQSTLAGTVVDLSLQAGEKVSAGQPVLTVADFSTWLVKTENLTEVDVVNVSLGQKVEIVLDALPTMVLTGTVTDINTRYVEKRGDITYTVTIELDSTDPQLRWGMTAAVRFIP